MEAFFRKQRSSSASSRDSLRTEFRKPLGFIAHCWGCHEGSIEVCVLYLNAMILCNLPALVWISPHIWTTWTHSPNHHTVLDELPSLQSAIELRKSYCMRISLCNASLPCAKYPKSTFIRKRGPMFAKIQDVVVSALWKILVVNLSVVSTCSSKRTRTTPHYWFCNRQSVITLLL